MTKQVFILILSCTMAFLSCGNVYGQANNKKTVAVITAEGESVSKDIRIGVTTGLQEGVFNSGEYTLLARGPAFEKALSEMKFQQSGAVSDDQLTAFGHAAGAEFVCYATISKYSETSYRISYKMINVASGEIVNMGSETVRNGTDGLLTATDDIAKKLFGNKPAPTPYNPPAPSVDAAELVRQANIYIKSGEYSKAVNYYEKYLAVKPSPEPLDFYYLGQACSYAAAYYIDPNNMASATAPDAIAAYEAALKNYIQKGDAAFAEVIKRRPNSYLGYMGRANIYALQDNYDQAKNKPIQGYAKPLYEEALTVMLNNNVDGARNKEIITVYRYLVSYYAAMKDNANVIDYSKKILDIDPNDDNARKTLTLLKVKY